MNGIATVLSLAAVGLGQPEGQDDLVRLVRVRNRAAVEAVVTLTCQYTKTWSLTGGRAPPFTPPGEYTRSGGAVRLRTRAGPKWADALVRDGRMLSMSNSSDPDNPGQVVGSVRAFDGQPIGSCDPMYEALFTLLGDADKPPCNLTFDEYMNRPHKVLRAERVAEAGREAVVVRAEFVPGSWAEYSFDPQVNYLMRRMKYSYVSGQGRAKPVPIEGETEVVRFREGGPGVFFPEEVVRTTSVDGKPGAAYRTVFRQVRINQPVPPDALAFRFPRARRWTT